MALVRAYVASHSHCTPYCSAGKPCLFITITTNPRWREITSELLPHQQPNDRPDVIARVFALKLDALLDDIQNKMCLGVVVGKTHSIEFQKRGLPHAHILVMLREDCKIKTPSDIDSVVSACIPDAQAS